ncbi:hypothetical protein PP304_gp023 [Gordonia phage Phendrix]|uniref:Uncharacterized protein n=1 Tax=Gordonia phage Phendrix TaxID=2593335 RepID=A0A514U0W6_9CAUD|nr:hypothetical protein PP304_gp023 [Gordonia phage Phendrix]QDK02571.1 hypothetical protein SEA_PHENDRIX_23 [Gordonia phage Phendrix]
MIITTTEKISEYHRATTVKIPIGINLYNYEGKCTCGATCTFNGSRTAFKWVNRHVWMQHNIGRPMPNRLLYSSSGY